MTGTSPRVFLQSAGIALQDAPKRFLRVLKTVEVRAGEGASLKWARQEPFESYKLAFEIAFDNPAVTQTGTSAALLLWFNIEVWRSVVLTIIHW